MSLENLIRRQSAAFRRNFGPALCFIFVKSWIFVTTDYDEPPRIFTDTSLFILKPPLAGTTSCRSIGYMSSKMAMPEKLGRLCGGRGHNLGERLPSRQTWRRSARRRLARHPSRTVSSARNTTISPNDAMQMAYCRYAYATCRLAGRTSTRFLLDWPRRLIAAGFFCCRSRSYGGLKIWVLET